VNDKLFDNFPHPLRVGFGASGAWGQSWFPADEAIALIRSAYDAGVRYFDTAGFYNRGEAERRLGVALTGLDDVFISTKTGTQPAGFGKNTKDFSEAAIRRDLDESLKRLGRSSLDTYYLHGPEDWVVTNTRPVFDDLKRQGLIVKAGICGAGEVLERAVSDRKIDAIMARFHLFDDNHASVFKAAKAAAISTVAIAPLGQAMYVRGFFRPTSRTRLWAIVRAMVRNPRQLARQRSDTAQALNRLDGFTAAQLMLGFVLSQPFIDIALTSTTRAGHLDETIQIARANGLDEDILSKLEGIAQKLNLPSTR